MYLKCKDLRQFATPKCFVDEILSFIQERFNRVWYIVSEISIFGEWFLMGKIMHHPDTIKPDMIYLCQINCLKNYHGVQRGRVGTVQVHDAQPYVVTLLSHNGSSTSGGSRLKKIIYLFYLFNAYILKSSIKPMI